ncbi:hypothetical protein CRUP_022677 [Coryphaenoides rupestris]|nr:hypothetical protein CRUP_022677 [Coryphaenoides rupestris]
MERVKRWEGRLGVSHHPAVRLRLLQHREAPGALPHPPVVVFQSVNLFVTTAFLLWLRSVAAMQAVEFFFGVVTATEVAYFSYIYSVVDADKYRKATSYCRSVQLLGYTVGAVLGQVLVSLDLLSYHGILVLTLVLISIGTVPACFLPMPRRTRPRSRPHPPRARWTTHRTRGTGELTAREKVGEGGGDDDEGSSVRPVGCGQLSLGAASGLEAAALFIMTFTGNIWVCYGGYVVFKGLYMLLITIAMYVCA